MRKFLILVLALLMYPTARASQMYNPFNCSNCNFKYNLSFDHRFRMVSSDNLFTLDEEAEGGWVYTRHRSRLTGQFIIYNKFDFSIRLTNEFWNTFVPEERDFDFNEVVFEWLNLKIKNEFLIPGYLTIGRQDIMLGKGFVVFDGTPHDGSRTAYFNAIRYEAQNVLGGALNGFYFYQDMTDDILPVIHEQDKILNFQPYHGAGLHYKGKFGKGSNITAYYMGKFTELSNYRPLESDIHTIGANIGYMPKKNLAFQIESAYQFGNYGEQNRSAFGGNGYLFYAPNIGIGQYSFNVVKVGTLFLSGDDKSTDKHEGWDPMFGQWPKWSESYIYTLLNEGEVAYWTNLFSIYAETEHSLSSNLRFSLTYRFLMAPRFAEYQNGALSGQGKNRGSLVIAKLRMPISNRISGHLLWENFTPGNFYVDDADGYNWVRFELLWKVD